MTAVARMDDDAIIIVASRSGATWRAPEVTQACRVRGRGCRVAVEGCRAGDGGTCCYLCRANLKTSCHE